MFERSKYKKFALMQLKGRWVTAVLMILILIVLIGLLNFRELKDTFSNIPEIAPKDLITTDNFFNMTSPSDNISSVLSLISVLIQAILTFSAISVFVKMSHSPEPVRLGEFVEGCSLWGKAILCNLWKNLWVFLWSLLFLIPGIVKFYAYSQMEFLLIEFPKLSVTKAMRISKELTRGHKMDLFIMDLSFIGWIILATIPSGIGLLWLIPYVQMTKINAYHALLKMAVTSGNITEEDLNTN